MVLYFITGNENKFIEAQAILGDIVKLKQLDIDLPEIQNVDTHEIIKAKLNEAIAHVKVNGCKSNNDCEHEDGCGKEDCCKKQIKMFMIDDTSVHFKCLNGLPGPFIKWFLQELKVEGLYDLVNKMGDDSAEVVCRVGLAKEGEIYFFDGSIKGKIVAPRGKRTFGWDPVFMPTSQQGGDETTVSEGKTYAEMTDDEKNAISHRRIAYQKLKDFLSS